MTAFETAQFSRAGAGVVAEAFGRHVIRLTAGQTGGRLGVFEAEVPAGEGPPFHVHEAEDEFFHVLEGRFTFWCGADSVELEPGGVIVIPRGAVHRFQNTGATMGRVLVVVTPGGFEGFFPAVATARPDGPEEIMQIAARYNLRFVPAPVAEAA